MPSSTLPSVKTSFLPLSSHSPFSVCSSSPTPSSLSSSQTPKHQFATLNYFHWDPRFVHEKPYELLTDGPPGFPSTNFEFRPAPRKQVVRDLRGPGENEEGGFTLDGCGFAVRMWGCEGWEDEEGKGGKVEEDGHGHGIKERRGAGAWTKETVEMKWLKRVEEELKREFTGDGKGSTGSREVEVKVFDWRVSLVFFRLLVSERVPGSLSAELFVLHITGGESFCYFPVVAC